MFASRLPSDALEPRELLVVRLGTMRFGEALAFQRAVANARISGSVAQDVLLLVEHPHVVTMGRSTRRGSLSSSPALLAVKGIEMYEVERGGDITYHGPGQLVGYPIIDLKRHQQDLHWYLRQVEESLIRTIAQYGLGGWRNSGYTGAWVGGEQERDLGHGGGAGGAPRSGSDSPQAPSTWPVGKIASIGVHARDWVTWHGFALNVVTDLSYFDYIVPCGITGVRMTSIAGELRARGADSETVGRVTVDAVSAVVTAAFGEVFGLAPRQVEVGELPAPRH